MKTLILMKGNVEILVKHTVEDIDLKIKRKIAQNLEPYRGDNIEYIIVNVVKINYPDGYSTKEYTEDKICNINHKEILFFYNPF